MSAATAPRRLTENERRELDRFGALANQLEKFAAANHASFIRAWLSDAHTGYRNDDRGYSVIQRLTGVAVVQFDDGSTRVIQAPVPFA